MAFFKYKATDISGKVVEGVMEAKEERSVITILQNQGYIPINVASSDAEKKGIENPLRYLFQRVPQNQVINFTRELSGLLKAGVPIDRSLKTLIGIVEKKSFKKILEGILSSIEKGRSVADSLEDFPSVFPPFYVNLIRAGEASATLDITLRRLSDFLSRSRELRNHIVSALIYPAILTIFSGLSIIILLTFVIPKFAATFSEMGQAIPLSTVVLMKISETIRNYWWLFIFSLIGPYLLFYSYKRTDNGRLAWDQFKLKLPLIGTIIRTAEVVRFGRAMGTLIKGGVPLLKTIDIVSNTINNRSIANAITRLHDSARRGEGLGNPLKREAVFPAMAVEMITVGEETGRLDEMLLEVADTFESHLKENAKRFLSILEPALIIIMGLVVGFIVVSMLLAIFSVNEIPF
jgi:general secretion pathway protein F